MDQHQAFSHLHYLAVDCGCRVAGTESAKKAGSYIQTFFEKEGMRAWSHDFRIPLCALDSAHLRVKIEEVWQDILHKPAWFAGSTEPGGVQVPLVYAGDGSEAVLKRVKPEGKAVLIARNSYLDYPDDHLYRRLLAHKPAAVILTTDAGHGGVPDVYYNFKSVANVPPPPTTVVHYEDGLKLSRLEGAMVQFEALYDQKEVTCTNHIGTIEGSDPDAGAVVVCAHYDSAPGGPGAADDAGGVALMMALASQFAAAVREGNRPRRTMHFIAWSGHEIGLHGSREFLLDNQQLLADTRFVLNFDVIGNHLSTNFLLSAAGNAVFEQVATITGGLGYDWENTPAVSGLDSLHFSSREIPCVNLLQGLSMWRDHTPQDHIEACSPEAFIDPLIFSRAVLEWATSAPVIEQGYSEDMLAGYHAYRDKFGWALNRS